MEQFGSGFVGPIFARLPMRYIYPLRSLSKGWGTSLTSPNSRFHQIVRELRSNLPIVAFSSGVPDAATGILTFQMLDVFSKEWYVHDFLLPEQYRIYNNLSFRVAHDGGLVCFLGIREDFAISVPLLVINPLTHDSKILPWQTFVYDEPRMLRLVVDRDSGQYKVIVVAHRIDTGLVDAEVYDSRTGMWSMLDSGDVFDVEFIYQEEGYGQTLGIYDCVRREFCQPDSRPRGHCETSTQFKGNHFRLQEETSIEEGEASETDRYRHLRREPYTISEFRCDDGTRRLSLAKRIPVVSYKWDGEVLPDGYWPELLACNDFVLFTGRCSSRNHGHHVMTPMRLFDLASGYWVPVCDSSFEISEGGFLCEFRKDAVS